MKISSAFLFLSVTAALAPAFGQAVQVSAIVGGAGYNVDYGGILALTAGDIGQPASAVVTVRNVRSTSIAVTGVVISGAAEMIILSSGFPATLAPGGTGSFIVQYVSTTGNPVSAQVSIAYTDSGVATIFPFNVTGSSPRLALSYYIAPDGTPADLSSGVLTFPATNVGSTTAAVVTVWNRGNAPGTVQLLTVSGTGFQLARFIRIRHATGRPTDNIQRCLYAAIGRR